MNGLLTNYLTRLSSKKTGKSFSIDFNKIMGKKINTFNSYYHIMQFLIPRPLSPLTYNPPTPAFFNFRIIFLPLYPLEPFLTPFAY